MFKSILCTASVLFSLISINSNAAIISYGGYTHDTTTDIVTGNGLEWLQWDRTLGESIDSIQSQLDTLEGGGWSLASNVQMAQLLNAFDFGLTFNSDENMHQGIYTGFSNGDPGTEADEMFIAMFGDTYAASGQMYCEGGDCNKFTSALFGADLDGDSRFNLALVYDDYILESVETQGRALIYDDIFYTFDALWDGGIALVRTVHPVPVPAAVWLFGSGFIGLMGFAKRKKF